MFESVRQRRTNNTLLFRGRYRHNLAYLRFRNLLHSRLKVCDLKTSRERNRNKKGSQHKQSVMIRKLRTLVRPRDHGRLLMEIANVHPVIKPFQSLTHNLIDFCFSFFYDATDGFIPKWLSWLDSIAGWSTDFNNRLQTGTKCSLSPFDKQFPFSHNRKKEVGGR